MVNSRQYSFAVYIVEELPDRTETHKSVDLFYTEVVYGDGTQTEHYESIDRLSKDLIRLIVQYQLTEDPNSVYHETGFKLPLTLLKAHCKECGVDYDQLLLDMAIEPSFPVLKIDTDAFVRELLRDHRYAFSIAESCLKGSPHDPVTRFTSVGDLLEIYTSVSTTVLAEGQEAPETTWVKETFDLSLEDPDLETYAHYKLEWK